MFCPLPDLYISSAPKIPQVLSFTSKLCPVIFSSHSGEARWAHTSLGVTQTLAPFFLFSPLFGRSCIICVIEPSLKLSFTPLAAHWEFIFTSCLCLRGTLSDCHSQHPLQGTNQSQGVKSCPAGCVEFFAGWKRRASSLLCSSRQILIPSQPLTSSYLPL